MHPILQILHGIQLWITIRITLLITQNSYQHIHILGSWKVADVVINRVIMKF